MLHQLVNVNIGSKSVIRANGVSFVEFNSIHELSFRSSRYLGQSCRLHYHKTLGETLSWKSDPFRPEHSFSDKAKYAASRLWKVKGVP